MRGPPAYAVADWKINEGVHLAESAVPFGILPIGPDGTRLAGIDPQ